MLPAVTVTKNVFSSVQAPGSTVGIMAYMACSSTGTVVQPAGFNRSDLAVTAFGYGPLTDYGAYNLAVANKPVLLVKGTGSVAGSYGTLSKTVAGTSVVTNGATAPFDHYAVIVTVVVGGTIGVTGITYTYSMDGGTVISGVQSLGTASTLTIANTGVSFALAAGTLVAGDTWNVYTERPFMNDSDVTAGLTALGNSRLPWEGVCIDSSGSGSTVALVDTALAALEAKGIFKFAILNSRMKTEPQPTGETEAAYATSLSSTFGTQTSIRCCVGADGGHVPSSITGWNLKRPTGVLLGVRAMQISIGEDAGYVARGPLTGAQIADAKGNPFDHDEDLYPGLDALRLTALRSFAPGGPQGVYINSPTTIQPSGGAFPYLQHIRIMNRACEIAWFVMTTQLGKGVRKNPKADPLTGAVYIFEPDAAVIDGLVNDALAQPLKGQVTDARFTLSRTDDMNATPLVVNSVLSIVSNAYIKGALVQAQFSKVITTTIT